MKKVKVNASRVYDILIEKGLIDRAGELCATVKKPCRAVILTDSNVAPLYAERLESSLGASGYECLRFVIEAGERSKSAENYLALLSFLASNKITRSDCLIALGGDLSSRYRIYSDTYDSACNGRLLGRRQDRY